MGSSVSDYVQRAEGYGKRILSAAEQGAKEGLRELPRSAATMGGPVLEDSARAIMKSARSAKKGRKSSRGRTRSR